MAYQPLRLEMPKSKIALEILNHFWTNGNNICKYEVVKKNLIQFEIAGKI